MAWYCVVGLVIAGTFIGFLLIGLGAKLMYMWLSDHKMIKSLEEL